MIAEPIIESGMVFGEYDTNDLFRIEKSQIYKEIGPGVKTVEFILKQNAQIWFVEAKTSCPNAAHRNESTKKQRNLKSFILT
jgi:hypothetical protein